MRNTLIAYAAATAFALSPLAALAEEAPAAAPAEEAAALEPAGAAGQDASRLSATTKTLITAGATVTLATILGFVAANDDDDDDDGTNNVPSTPTSPATTTTN